MSIRKIGNKYATVHCHGNDKGKIIAKFDTKAEALAQHRAIEANKRRKHHSAENGDFLDDRMEKFKI